MAHDSNLRPAVRVFAEQMEGRLRENDSKKERQRPTKHECFAAIQEKHTALVRGVQNGHKPVAEAADLANWILMLLGADVNELDPKPLHECQTLNELSRAVRDHMKKHLLFDSDQNPCISVQAIPLLEAAFCRAMKIQATSEASAAQAQEQFAMQPFSNQSSADGLPAGFKWEGK